ncbi:MAG TPA: hypothetical protein VFF92_02245 [Dehalococcoidales bacterium]|nr:hypothetical protein [Dehalococcoidales bacterium]
MRLLYINVPRFVLIAIISLLFLIMGRSHFTFAQTENGMEFSFVSLKMSVAETPAVSSGLIEEVQEVSALYEHYIISTALQSMRVIERVKDVPSVSMATNDMAKFPSAEHSLYPHYLTKRYSQFKYTVDSDGIVDIDTTSPTIVCNLEQIENYLNSIE